LERKKSVAFDKLLLQVAMGNRDVDTLTLLAGRLARLDRELNEVDRQEIKTVSGGVPLQQITSNLLAAVDPDRQIEKAQELFATETPDESQLKQAAAALIKEACKPLDNPKLRETLVAIKQRNE
jgi:type I restriction enzyme, R subunit